MTHPAAPQVAPAAEEARAVPLSAQMAAANIRYDALTLAWKATVTIYGRRVLDYI